MNIPLLIIGVILVLFNKKLAETKFKGVVFFWEKIFKTRFKGKKEATIKSYRYVAIIVGIAFVLFAILKA